MIPCNCLFWCNNDHSSADLFSTYEHHYSPHSFPSFPDPHFSFIVLTGTWEKTPLPSSCALSWWYSWLEGHDSWNVCRPDIWLTGELLFLVIRVSQGQARAASVALNVLAFVGEKPTESWQNGMWRPFFSPGCKLRASLPWFPGKQMLGCWEWHLSQCYCYMIPTFLRLRVRDHQIVPVKNLLVFTGIGRPNQIGYEILIPFLLQNFHWFCMCSRSWELPRAGFNVSWSQAGPRCHPFRPKWAFYSPLATDPSSF